MFPLDPRLNSPINLFSKEQINNWIREAEQEKKRKQQRRDQFKKKNRPANW